MLNSIAEVIEGKKKHAIGGRVGYNDGQLVTPSVDGARPGYRGDKTQEVLKAYKEYKKSSKKKPKKIEKKI